MLTQMICRLQFYSNNDFPKCNMRRFGSSLQRIQTAGTELKVICRTVLCLSFKHLITLYMFHQLYPGLN